MARCVTCGSELHPERAERYDYCTRPECQRQNARGLTVLAVGVNKAADQYEVLDGRARAEKAGAADPDDRRAPACADRRTPAGAGRPAGGRRQRTRPRPPWTRSQQELARIYNARGLRPDEIARKLGLSAQTVIEMILATKARPGS